MYAGSPVVTRVYVWGSGADCTNVNVISDTELTCVTSPGVPGGARPVEVWSLAGYGILENAFNYTDALMQTFTTDDCFNLPNNTITTLFDIRNNQPYYVKRINALCWMVSNLRYGGDGGYDASLGYQDDRYATTSSGASGTSSSWDDTRPLAVLTEDEDMTNSIPQFVDPGGSSDYTNTNPGVEGQPDTYGFYGYLYNWCAAMGGQPNACDTSLNSESDLGVSICPAGWRLATSTEFNRLNRDVNDGATNTSQGLITNWLVVYSGQYDTRTNLGGSAWQGRSGYYASSDGGATHARIMNIGASNVSAGNTMIYTSTGTAVRCTQAAFKAPTVTDVVTSTGVGINHDIDYTVKDDGQWPNAVLGTTTTTRTLTITGTNFYRDDGIESGAPAGSSGGIRVRIGDTYDCSTDLTILNATSITCTIPYRDMIGDQLVQVTTVAGASSTEIIPGTNAITYMPRPTITSVSADVMWGGNTLTITGTDLGNNGTITTRITVGGTTDSNTCIQTGTLSSTTVKTCTLPALAANNRGDVRLHTAYGTGSATVTYVQPTARDGDLIQTINTTDGGVCPTDNKIMVVDARDNRTYWIQRLADGRCWMLTNLAYAGGTSNGGNNDYGDAKTITNSNTLAYTEAYYMIPDGANPTDYPDSPSQSTDGGAVANPDGLPPQYGYLYNWCAAMGVQQNTDACLQATTPNSNANTSICPAGWRLPADSAFRGLNDSVNNAASDTDAGLLATWFGMYSGRWNNGFTDQGASGTYWTSREGINTSAYNFHFHSTGASIVSQSTTSNKQNGFAVRCFK